MTSFNSYWCAAKIPNKKLTAQTHTVISTIGHIFTTSTLKSICGSTTLFCWIWLFYDQEKSLTTYIFLERWPFQWSSKNSEKYLSKCRFSKFSLFQLYFSRSVITLVFIENVSLNSNKYICQTWVESYWLHCMLRSGDPIRSSWVILSDLGGIESLEL